MGKLKVGLFGAGRGCDLALDFMSLGCDIVAVCDMHEERLAAGIKKLGVEVTAYKNFDEFIEHDMDIVILANLFHEHAKYTVECFKRNIHVYCECISNATMSEGVELVREFEKSKSIYMLAENYPQMIFNREMKRVCDGGTLGKIVYAEGEYNHPYSLYDDDFRKTYIYSPDHWRNYLPSTYYITHALGPVMWITGATPKKVNAVGIFAPHAPDAPSASYDGDCTVIMLTQNDDGSVFRVMGTCRFGGHHNSYRICGLKGQIENLRGKGDTVMLRYNDWEKPEGVNEINEYQPEWNDEEEDTIQQSGHGGGDYLTARHFVRCVEAGRQPDHPFDIYSATVMSSVAILGHRSALEGNCAIEIPDFRLEEDRVKYENDRKSPFFEAKPEDKIPVCATHPDYKPSELQLKKYMESLNK